MGLPIWQRHKHRCTQPDVHRLELQTERFDIRENMGGGHAQTHQRACLPGEALRNACYVALSRAACTFRTLLNGLRVLSPVSLFLRHQWTLFEPVSQEHKKAFIYIVYDVSLKKTHYCTLSSKLYHQITQFGISITQKIALGCFNTFNSYRKISDMSGHSYC